MIDAVLNAHLFADPTLGYVAACVVRAATILLALLATKRFLAQAWRAAGVPSTLPFVTRTWRDRVRFAPAVVRHVLAAANALLARFWRDRVEIKAGLLLVAGLLFLQILSGPGGNAPKVLTVYMLLLNAALQLLFFGLSKEAR